MILDLEKIDQWMEASSKVSKTLIPGNLLETIFKENPEKMFPDTLSYLDRSFNKHHEYFDFQGFEDKLDLEFTHHFDQIRVFHSCRTINGLESYTKRGIEPTSEKLLEELALVAFSKHLPEEQIIKTVREKTIHDFDRGVFCFTDIYRPLDRSCSHYLQSGSEKLQGLLHDLKLGFSEVLSEQGEAYIIECIIPIESIEKEERTELWRELITEYFINTLSNDKNEIPDYCIKTKGKISPEEIVKFHQIEDHLISCVCPKN